jgi:hypothetical protein
MERKGQETSDTPSQMAGEGQNRMSEKRKVIMAVTQMLDSGTLDERSSQLLEQLADYIWHLPTEAARETGRRRRPYSRLPPQRGSQWRLNLQRS